MTVSTESLPLSMVLHTVFCPRRTWLEATGERVESSQMEEGIVAHARVDSAGPPRAHESRSCDVSHAELNLVGRCDVLTGAGDAVNILEYKATPVRRVAEVTEAMRVQLALQRLCMEDAGTLVESQGIYFTNHRRRVSVTLTEADFAAAVGLRPPDARNH